MTEVQGRLSVVSGGDAGASAAARAVSGAGMDRRIPPSRWKRLAPFLGGGAVAAVLIGLWLVRPATGSVQSVAGDRLTVAAVEKALFEDFVPSRGTVEPARTVYLDVVVGGQVQSIDAQDGQRVEAGDLVVSLSSSQLELQVIQSEAQIAQALNQVRSAELQIEQRRVGHQRDLVDMDYQITRLEREEARLRPLVERGALHSESELQDLEDELSYQRRRRDLAIAAQAADEKLMRAQMEQNAQISERGERNLELARKNAENLQIRAPVAGVLTALDAELGQSLSQGARVGQIDTPDDYKLTASLDELYLSRIAAGQTARADIDGKAVPLTVSRILSQVKDGQFKAELKFDGEQPGGLRRGQSFPLRIYTADAEDALVLPAGAFLAETGGNWAFVLTKDGKAAERRSIKTGRRNSRYVEVVDGLEPGDRVIVSSYEPFGDVERLELK